MTPREALHDAILEVASLDTIKANEIIAALADRGYSLVALPPDGEREAAGLRKAAQVVLDEWDALGPTGTSTTLASFRALRAALAGQPPAAPEPIEALRDARIDLDFYLVGAIAAGLPPKAADSILELADAMVRAALPPDGERETAREALVLENTHLKEALGIIAAQPESAPDAIPITARNVARAALAGQGAANLETAAAEHEHYWVDVYDDETCWHCTICGLTEAEG